MALIGSINPETQEEKQGEQLAVSGLLGSVQCAGPSQTVTAFSLMACSLATPMLGLKANVQGEETQQQVLVFYVK